MIHVDISHNVLRLPEMTIISEGLKENHTIYGLHVIGNEAQVNT